jgi:hypothetical protein
VSPEKELNVDQIIDTFGELVSVLAAFAAKVPAQSFMINQSIRPTEETIEAFEDAVYRLRDRSGVTFRILNSFFIDSLEAFEAGKVFDAVPPLLQAVEQLVELHKDETVEYTDQQQKRIREFHQRLEKILPESSQPEVDLPTPESY